jgi:hypothetical protein
VREAASIIYAPYARHQKYIIISRFELEGSEQLNSPVLFNQTLSLEPDFLKDNMFFFEEEFQRGLFTCFRKGALNVLIIE